MTQSITDVFEVPQYPDSLFRQCKTCGIYECMNKAASDLERWRSNPDLHRCRCTLTGTITDFCAGNFVRRKGKGKGVGQMVTAVDFVNGTLSVNGAKPTPWNRWELAW